MEKSNKDKITQEIINRALKRDEILEEEKKKRIQIEATIATLKQNTNLSHKEIERISQEVLNSHSEKQRIGQKYSKRTIFILIIFIPVLVFTYLWYLGSKQAETQRPQQTTQRQTNPPGEKIVQEKPTQQQAVQKPTTPAKKKIEQKKQIPQQTKKKLDHSFSKNIKRIPAVYRGFPVETQSSERDTDELENAYRAKLANPDYLKWKNRSPIPNKSQNFKEETLIKKIISNISKKIKLPEFATPITIPVVSGNPPVMDGWLEDHEWENAVKVPIGTRGANTLLLMLSDGKNLYIGCDVPEEVTADGYDQFRFYYHIDISPLIRNERIHVRNSGSKGLRSTNVAWEGKPAKNDNERWKKYAITDWNVYKLSHGTSSIEDHREYEAMLNLKEVGLHKNVPFPVFIEVETDPKKNDKGKFAGRSYLGKLGLQKAPVWMVIE